MKMHKFKIGLMMLAAMAGLSAIVMLLWNALLPGIFSIASINFWQAAGILVLSRILFGGFGRGRGFGHGRGGDHGRNAMREKWMKMTPEERKEFIRKHRKHGRDFPWGRPFPEESDSPENKE